MASGHLKMKTPHQQAEHMAAPTSPCDIVQKTLANSEPSTHGTPVPSISASCGAESHRLFLVAQPDCPASRELRVLVAANCVELFLSETGKGAKVRPGELKPQAELD